MVGNKEKRQNTHHPQFCTRDVDRRFCGGGEWFRSLKMPLLLSSINWNNIQDGRQRQKTNPKKPWACVFTLPPCGNRHCFSESEKSLSQVTIENKVKQNIHSTKVASAKVAFDTVR